MIPLSEVVFPASFYHTQSSTDYFTRRFFQFFHHCFWESMSTALDLWKGLCLFLFSKEEVMKAIIAAVMAVIVAAVIIFSVVTGVKGLISSAQNEQSQAIAAIDGQPTKGGAQ